jgi:hypothetical protein
LHYTAINSHLRPTEVQYVLDDCGAKALVASEAMADVVADLDLSRISVRISAVGELTGFERYDDVLAATEPGPLDDEREGREMLYSSGTTGRPKGVRKPLPGTIRRRRPSRWRRASPCTAPAPVPCTSRRRRCTTPRRSSTPCRCSAWAPLWW